MRVPGLPVPVDPRLKKDGNENPFHMTRITNNGFSVSGRSIMDLLCLGVDQGAELRVEVQGPCAAALLEELTELFNHGFSRDEPMLPVPDAHHE